MPVAEIKIRTTHDGTQAERSMNSLKKSMEEVADTVTGKLGRSIAGLFGVEKIIQFGRAVTATVDDVGKLVEKLREGKETLEGVKKEADMAPSHVGALAGISEAGKPTTTKWNNFKAYAARFFYGVMGSAIPTGMLLGDEDFEAKRAHALFGDLGTLGVAGMQGQYAKQQAKREALRQQRIKEIIDAEENATGHRGGFGYQAGVNDPNRYFMPGIPDASTIRAHRSVELERQSLEELRRITRILDRGPSTNSGTVFPQ